MHNARIFVPAQHRVLPVPRLRVLQDRTHFQKLLLRHDPRLLARDGAVDVLHDLEVGGEQDIEVALVDLILYNESVSETDA